MFLMQYDLKNPIVALVFLQAKIERSKISFEYTILL